MIRDNQLEILDQPGVRDDLVERAYRDIARVHTWLGDTRYIVQAIREDRLPVRRILDVGCATGIIAAQIGRRLGVDVVGIDLSPHRSIAADIRILQADATCDPLPTADVAYSMHLGHHLSEDGLRDMIRNVGRYCRRFIVLDLVRNRLPLGLFRLFVAPLLCPIDAADGELSVRRSYTPRELKSIAASALDGTGGSFRLSVAPGYVRQVIDITYAHQNVSESPRPCDLSEVTVCR
jgi:SAM-dependent methyltransferase